MANPQGHQPYVLQALPSYLVQYLLVKADGGDNDGDESDSCDKGEDMDDDDGSQPQDERWFAKAPRIIDLVNETSNKVWKIPAFCVSIDEQIKTFKGCSGQTFPMKNKPISKVCLLCKLWVLLSLHTHHMNKQCLRREDNQLGLIITWEASPERIKMICCNDGQPFHFVQGSFRSKGDECCHLWYCMNQARLATERV